MARERFYVNDSLGAALDAFGGFSTQTLGGHYIFSSYAEAERMFNALNNAIWELLEDDDETNDALANSLLGSFHGGATAMLWSTNEGAWYPA